ncbi:hypothetical protein GUJ93_ZPchr0005g16154 [Zizania palustris]|uniref:Uncharacterized protein n=1 Tax=Zizania palustris TaxID=103762 RepID=A0A8J5VGV6_ZIZPA|nr:hypothetical protein GUJ93_ZPchr0005g16154 [Zizania palustris]
MQDAAWEIRRMRMWPVARGQGPTMDAVDGVGRSNQGSGRKVAGGTLLAARFVDASCCSFYGCCLLLGREMGKKMKTDSMTNGSTYDRWVP